MERAVYFDAWFPRQHNYHPSLPPRRLRMLDDLVEYRATMLVWSALGGGSIALPYLEQEAFGDVPPRYRLYGFVNDSEFVAECHKRGIKIFGVVFECQGWEFPIELNDAEDQILAMNEPRGAGRPGWLGLREFSGNRYPKLLPPFERYFPGGLKNSLGEPVHDLLEEAATRDIHGRPCHSQWVECPDRTHYAYNMDRNNPVWREYLKAIIRIQVDAGVDGIELDEADTPLTSLPYGGCFCRDCRDGFREYLRALPAAELPKELEGTDLTNFDYGKWLLTRGYDFQEHQETNPLYWDYLRFQQHTAGGYFAELADYARAYAASKGRTVLVSGNFFRLSGYYYAMASKVDVLITEMFNTDYRQPAWCRYCAGFAGDMPLITVGNPYGGVGPDLLPKLQAGHGYDLFRMMTYEAAALGISMSIPYGAWMGSVIQDAFYAPHDLITQIQSFIADNAGLYSTRTFSETAVVFSTRSDFEQSKLRAGIHEAVTFELGGGSRDDTPFWQTCERLIEARQPYDVVMFADGAERADLAPLAAELAQYRTLLVPACSWLTERQADLIGEFADAGGQVLVLGTLGSNLPASRIETLLGHRNVRVGREDASIVSDLNGGAQITVDPAIDCGINIHRIEAGAALHLIRYDYDEARDCVPVLSSMSLRVRLSVGFGNLTCYSQDGELAASLTSDGDSYLIALRNVPLYSVIVLHPTEAPRQGS